MNQLIEDVLIRGILESEEKEAEAEGGGKTLEDSNEYVYEEYLDSNEEMQQPPILDESEDRVGNDLQGPSMLGFRDLVLFLFLVQYFNIYIINRITLLWQLWQLFYYKSF